MSLRAANYGHPRFILHSGYTIKIFHEAAPRPVWYRGREHSAGVTMGSRPA